MSLILEALRKSEAERRRGLAPDLFVELPPVMRRRDSALMPTLWWALAVTALAIGAWLTRGLWSPAPRAEIAVATTVRDGASRQLSRDRSEARLDAVDADPRSVGNVPAQPVPVTDARPSAEVPITKTLAPAPGQTRTASGIPPAVQERPAAPPPVPVRTPLPVPVNPPAVTEPAPPPIPPASDNAATLQLADLPAEQRKQLPPLRISMHMWDQNPARRFVIIDGARLGEGDRIGDAVIEQIAADSVLLDWNGRRLRLPLLR